MMPSRICGRNWCGAPWAACKDVALPRWAWPINRMSMTCAKARRLRSATAGEAGACVTAYEPYKPEFQNGFKPSTLAAALDEARCAAAAGGHTALRNLEPQCWPS
jgi:hypothetical protein